MKPVSKYHPLKHYEWGGNCDGWNLVEDVSLSIKQERMPAGAAEIKHYHQEAQQFFFILKGVAVFETPECSVTVNSGEGLHIPAGIQHKICNGTAEDLEFILCSQPSAQNDRINCE